MPDKIPDRFLKRSLHLKDIPLDEARFVGVDAMIVHPDDTCSLDPSAMCLAKTPIPESTLLVKRSERGFEVGLQYSKPKSWERTVGRVPSPGDVIRLPVVKLHDRLDDSTAWGKID